MAEVDPDQETALRRLRAAFGLVEILRIIDHAQDDNDELIKDGELTPPADEERQLVGGALRWYTTRWRWFG